MTPCAIRPCLMRWKEKAYGAPAASMPQMSAWATETITSNPRVLGADTLVVYDAQSGKPGGLGEEDFVSLVLPYIHSAREGVLRLGSLLETYGTYEMNGIAFCDHDEIWWMETIGGHHWMARRVPDDVYVAMPNQLGIDTFVFDDPAHYLCSADLRAFVETNHLDLWLDGTFRPRLAFGSHDDADNVSMPGAWFIERTWDPHTVEWDRADADHARNRMIFPGAWCQSASSRSRM